MPSSQQRDVVIPFLISLLKNGGTEEPCGWLSRKPVPTSRSALSLDLSFVLSQLLKPPWRGQHQYVVGLGEHDFAESLNTGC